MNSKIMELLYVAEMENKHKEDFYQGLLIHN